MPPDHRSHDHLNEFKEIKVDDSARIRWKEEFERLKKENEGEQVLWVLVDGFLLYWHKVCRPRILVLNVKFKDPLSRESLTSSTSELC